MLRLFLMLLVVGLLTAALIGFHLFKSNILKKVTGTIQSQQAIVSTTSAVMQQWQPTINAVGSLRASKGADLSLETSGVIDQINFDSGRDVEAGAVLLRLRPNDDPAKLDQLKASADLSEINYRRDLQQLAARGVAQSTVDTDSSNLKSARAQVVAQQALMGEKVMRAPFRGRLGVRQVDVGQYLPAGTTVVTLQALDPMFLDFYLPQQTLGQIRVGQAVLVTVDAYPGKTFTGKVTSMNSKIDASSRMLQVRASLANPDGALLPGMFATAGVTSGEPQSLVTIPQTAVAYNPYGSLVYVVQSGKDAQGKSQASVRQQFVTTGETRGDQVSILKGLKAGDVIVTAGQLKLHNDSLVQIDNSVKLTNDVAPVPQDH
ncbi:efflux transporter, RND family, MFP subunit [Burkholderia gladioli]|uniref:Efflux transporter, RND family, MFP subunit n=2 Tax=Burkholderia gladioli TaxID=28095 RepID=A0A095F0X7_BURGA|nr:efflux transporter, RND family, MFP subunit [Burkholderia gladioli]ASD79909.1 MexH family multidrug efflux RND transporter periplasmic adaptor subunit [Burkholderia gladioli pv. gladioli]AWY54849.1 MexH family multidrug efflux RND transporter periplasmic adaptor subunit [Burkholderia gladioli pv. gladioli]KGC11331.1 efflux transporter, RND family, MFP subunit [Burkholderia gladioli]PEH37862.1 MexH family multidrug efflux RND transporter periplasmic adaptor subunit [Burkholderia gladioli]